MSEGVYVWMATWEARGRAGCCRLSTRHNHAAVELSELSVVLGECQECVFLAAVCRPQPRPVKLSMSYIICA